MNEALESDKTKMAVDIAVTGALAAKGEDFYFESLENVRKDLEIEREEYDEQAKKYAATGLGISGAGVADKIVPEFYSQTAEQIDLFTQNEFATLGLVGALGVSSIPAYLTKKIRMKEMKSAR